MSSINQNFKNSRLSAYDSTTVSASMYNLLIGGTVLWGIIINIIMSLFFQEEIMSMNYILVLVMYFIGSFLGILVVYKSSSAIVSFIAFTVLSLSMGLLLTFFVSYYDVASISTAFVVTAIVVAIMMILGSIFPKFFLGIGRMLFVALLITFIAEIVISLIMKMDTSIFDYIIVAIFSGYIGFDWARAQRYPKTADNAVDSAADIYVDIINMFIRILSIVGKKK